MSAKFLSHRSVNWIALAAAILFLQTTLNAAALKPETLSAWEEYTQFARSRMQERLRPEGSFLSIDEKKGGAAKVKRGEPQVFPVGQTPQKIRSGLIHDWTGVEFIPNAKLADVLATIRDYAHYKDFYYPAVVDSRLLDNAGAKDRFSMLLVNKSVVSKTALDSDYESSYIRLDDHRWYSISETTRIQEVENYGTPQQHILPENQGTGLIWKLLSMARFEERDGGVYIELEAIALSRDIPASLRWIANPIVRRVSKSSLFTSLQQTSEAVYSRNSSALQISARDRHAAEFRTPPAPGNSVILLR